MVVTGVGTALGPLTTPWAIPDDCKVHIVNCPTCDGGFQGQQCVVRSGTGQAEDHTRCWPPATAKAGTPRWPFMGWGFYSPGLACPTGYTTACTAQYGGRAEWPIQFALVPGETAVGCCPEGYHCDNRNGNTCVMEATEGAEVVVTTGSCLGSEMVSVGLATLPDIVTVEPTGTGEAGPIETVTREMVLLAPMFQLNYKASDLEVTTSTSAPTTGATSASSAATPTSPLPGGGTPNDTDGAPSGSSADRGDADSGLSVGAAAGVGVGAALGAILLAVLAWWLWRANARKKKQQQQQQERHSLTHGYPGSGERYEVEGSQGPWPVGAAAVAAAAAGQKDGAGYYHDGYGAGAGGYPPSELPAGCPPSELNAGYMPGELGGEDRAELAPSEAKPGRYA